MTDVFPFVIERSKNYASIFFRNQKGILRYRVLASNTLDDAYVGQAGTPRNGVVGVNGTNELFIVNQDATYRSHAIRSKGLGLLDETTRGQTRAVWDPDEFFDPGTNPAIPPDNRIAYLRVQTASVASGNTFGLEGPVLIFQDPNYAVVPRPALTIHGTAPDVGAVAGAYPPLESLEFRVPFYGDSLVIFNHGMAPLFLSMGRDIPLMQLDGGADFSHTSGQKDSIIIAANGANPTFSILMSTVQGAR